MAMLGLGASALVLLAGVGILLARVGRSPDRPAASEASPAPASRVADPPAPPPSPAPPTRPAAAAQPEPKRNAAQPRRNAAEAKPAAAPRPAASEARPAAVEPVARRHPRLLGGKKVVLEYDPKPTPTPLPAAPAGVDPDQVARARAKYLTGNQRLFAGNVDGAIASYREALAIYPGYVAGYRGLGLAYAERGDRANAVSALNTYLRTVPTARDVPLIRKRLERLGSP
jgi:hypothetical protein